MKVLALSWISQHIYKPNVAVVQIWASLHIGSKKNVNFLPIPTLLSSKKPKNWFELSETMFNFMSSILYNLKADIYSPISSSSNFQVIQNHKFQCICSCLARAEWQFWRWIWRDADSVMLPSGFEENVLIKKSGFLTLNSLHFEFLANKSGKKSNTNKKK